MSINNPRNNPNFALNQISLRAGSSLLIYLLIFCKVTPCITHALERASGEAVRRNKRGRKRLVLIPYCNVVVCNRAGSDIKNWKDFKRKGGLLAVCLQSNA